MHLCETEVLAGAFAIQLEPGRAETRGAAERVAVQSAHGGLKARRIVAQFPGKGARPQTHAAGHGLLHVRVAGQRQPALTLAEVLQGFGDRFGGPLQG